MTDTENLQPKPYWNLQPKPYCGYCGAELENEDCPNYGNGPEHAGLSTSAKIKAIEESGLRLAYDGCHKIYVIETDDEREKMIRDYGYEPADIFPASEIRNLIEGSCSLVFVRAASLRSDHPWGISQCTRNIYEAVSA